VVVMAKKDMYRIMGKTTDGKVVVGGIYEFTSTYGYPLVELLYDMQGENLVVDWLDFYKSALEFGMKSDRILGRMREAILEVYGDKHCKAVMDRMTLYLENESV
jgi:hypothetical protein